MNQPIVKNDAQAWHWISFAMIAASVWIVYAPSLMHVARADQIMYFAEVAHRSSLWDLTVGSMDLNRHRVFNPGDELLFRPVVYIFLGIEKFIFGYRFMWWQGVGIILHLIVVWQLLKILLKIHRGVVSVAVAAYFSLFFVNLEMVTWQHIHGYMIFVALSLVALSRFIDVLQSKVPQPKDCAMMFFLLLIASLTHEMGNVVALFLGIACYLYKREHTLFYRCLLLVPAVYVLASLLNAWVHPFQVTIYHQQNILENFLNSFYVMAAWTYVGLFPFEFEWLYRARNILSPEMIHLIKWPNLSMGFSVGTLMMLMLTTFFISKRQKILMTISERVCVVVCFLLAGVFAFMIAVGRGNQWSIGDVVRINTYYMYIFWVFFILGVFTLIPWHVIHKRMKGILCVLLILLMVWQGKNLYAVNESQVRDNNNIIVLVQTLEMLIAQHGHEPGFSFYVDPKYPGNYIYSELRRKDDPLSKQYSFIEALYPIHFNSQDPRYKFRVQ